MKKIIVILTICCFLIVGCYQRIDAISESAQIEMELSSDDYNFIEPVFEKFIRQLGNGEINGLNHTFDIFKPYILINTTKEEETSLYEKNYKAVAVAI